MPIVHRRTREEHPTGRDTTDERLSKAERKAAAKAARKAAEKDAGKPKKRTQAKKAKKAEKAALAAAGEPTAERSDRRIAKDEQRAKEKRRATREPGGERPFEGGTRKGGKGEGGTGQGAGEAVDAAPEVVELADGSSLDLSEVEDAAVAVADFSGLAEATPRILELIAPLDPRVRRSAFDSYVTAVTVHGLAAEDLPALELRAGGAEEDRTGEGRAREDRTERDRAREDRAEKAPAADAAATPRRGGAPANTAPAKRAPGTPAATKPRRAAPASTAKAPGRPEQLPPSERIRRAGAAAGAAKRESDSTGSSSRRRPAATTPTTPATPTRRVAGAPKALMDRVAAKPPRNNDQRTAIIVAHLARGRKPVDETAIAAMYEKLAWRVPVNMGASVRQAVRSGFLEAGEHGTISLGEAGRAWLDS